MAQTGTELFSTSWAVHRCSPLYHSEINNSLLDEPSSLQTYAGRLSDTLTGNVLGGIVQLDLTEGSSSLLDEALSKAGALLECKWQSLATWAYWNEEHSLLEDPDQESALAISAENSAGILISLKYENANYKAALLAGPDGYHNEENPASGNIKASTTYLPVLVTRMPNALRSSLISFLSEQFDTRISILRLSSGFLCSALESYLEALERRSSQEESQAFIESVIKETSITLSFPPGVSSNLRTLEVQLPRESLGNFYKSGRRSLENAASLGPRDGGSTSTSPFLSALSEYFDRTLAMKLDWSDSPGNQNLTAAGGKGTLKLSKISCGAFVLGAEGRVKFLANPGRTISLDDSSEDEGDETDIEELQKRLIWKANEELLRTLVSKAIGRRGQRSSQQAAAK